MCWTCGRCSRTLSVHRPPLFMAPPTPRNVIRWCSFSVGGNFPKIYLRRWGERETAELFSFPPFVNERKNKKWREFSFFFLRGHLENGEKGMTEKMRVRKNRAQKMGAFYVEFIFHAWLARDFAFSVVGPHQWVAIASKFNSAFVRNCYFFFLDLFSKKITLNFFYYLKCPPAPNAQDLVLPFTFFCFLFTEKENEKIHFQFLFFSFYE